MPTVETEWPRAEMRSAKIFVPSAKVSGDVDGTFTADPLGDRVLGWNSDQYVDLLN